jgi:hypothetical protein
LVSWDGQVIEGSQAERFGLTPGCTMVDLDGRPLPEDTDETKFVDILRTQRRPVQIGFVAPALSGWTTNSALAVAPALSGWTTNSALAVAPALASGSQTSGSQTSGSQPLGSQTLGFQTLPPRPKAPPPASPAGAVQAAIRQSPLYERLPVAERAKAEAKVADAMANLEIPSDQLVSTPSRLSGFARRASFGFDSSLSSSILEISSFALFEAASIYFADSNLALPH